MNYHLIVKRNFQKLTDYYTQKNRKRKEMRQPKESKLSTTILLLTLFALSNSQYLSPFFECDIPLNLTDTEEVIWTEIDSENDNLLAYYATINANASTIAVYAHEITNCSEQINGTYQSSELSVIDKDTFKMRLLTDMVEIYYQIGLEYKIVVLQKITLDVSFQQSSICKKYLKGLYLHHWQLLYYNNDTIQGIESEVENYTTKNIIAEGDINTNTISYKTNYYENRLIIFYEGLGSFAMKVLENSTDMVNDFQSPYSFPINGSFQCFTLSSSGSVVYILKDDGILNVYSVADATYTIYSYQVGILDALDCYYSNSSSNLVFITKNSSTEEIQFQHIPLSTISYNITITSIVTNLTQATFVNKPHHAEYVIYTNGSSIMVMSTVKGYCADFYFYNSTSMQCETCLPYCLKCGNDTVCRNCTYRYYESEDDTQCIPCSASNCIYCPDNFCISCDAGYTLANGQCTTPIQEVESNKQQMEGLLNNPFMNGLNKVPSGRRLLQPFFYYFSNFDDFWLYQYHERNYGNTMNNLFGFVRDLEQQKWELVQSYKFEAFLMNFGINQTKLLIDVDNKTVYAGSKFSQIEGNGEGFLVNSWLFLTLNLILTIITFLLMRGLFFLLFNYRISVVLRPFSFWPYLGIILLDGNSQYFSFLFFSQATKGFSFSFHQKIVNLINLMFFFVYILYSISSYFMYFSLYKKLSKYFFDNARPKMITVFYLFFINFLRNFVLGAIHNFLRYNSDFQILMLLLVEVVFISIILMTIISSSTIKQKTPACIFLTFSFLRICLLFTLYYQQHETDEVNLTMFEQIIETIVMLFIGLNYIGVLLQFVSITIDIITNKKKAKEEEENEEEEEEEENEENQKSEVSRKSTKKIQPLLQEQNKIEVEKIKKDDPQKEEQTKKEKVRQKTVFEKGGNKGSKILKVSFKNQTIRMQPQDLDFQDTYFRERDWRSCYGM